MEEGIKSRQGEGDRLKVRHEVEERYVTQRKAGGQLQLIDPQVRRLLVRVRAEEDHRIAHRSRGRPSNRQLAVRVRERILTRVRQRSADFAYRGGQQNHITSRLLFLTMVPARSTVPTRTAGIRSSDGSPGQPQGELHSSGNAGSIRRSKIRTGDRAPIIALGSQKRNVKNVVHLCAKLKIPGPRVQGPPFE
jgi:hypothetical protein